MEKTTMITSSSAEETHDVGTMLATCLHANDVIVLTGDLGAGKTQLTQGVALGLGIIDDVVSPTFNILLSYEGGRLPLYHFDLYRLDGPEELEDIDYYATLEADGVSLIEWGDRFPEELPDDYLAIDITSSTAGTRTLHISATGSRSAELLETWMNRWNA